VEPERRSLVLSERAELREGKLATLKEGDVCKAVVRSLADFGAFVELLDDNGSATFVEGLVHVSEISWDRVLHPQVGSGIIAKLTCNEPVRCRVILSRERGPRHEYADRCIGPHSWMYVPSRGRGHPPFSAVGTRKSARPSRRWPSHGLCATDSMPLPLPPAHKRGNVTRCDGGFA
jgi:hypothetical protein